VPAAAVIPAPIAYIKVVAVKKLVVGFLVGLSAWLRKGSWLVHAWPSSGEALLALSCRRSDARRLL
jgi:hypothetical protein